MHIHIDTCVYPCVHVYVCVYIYRERDRERERETYVHKGMITYATHTCSYGGCQTLTLLTYSCHRNISGYGSNIPFRTSS